MLKRLILLLLLVALPLTACAADEAVDGYRQISPEEAQALLDSADPPLLLDVRTVAEYLEGHIPGAICVPNETIGDARPEALPDPARTILVYCRSGRRSREAAEKLIGLGYEDVRDLGGILSWPGPVVTTEEEEEAMHKLQLTLGDTPVSVTWEENPSVRALQKLAEEAPLAIQMSMYGGFEQVGPIGASLPRSDAQTKTVAGDIVLYQGSQIVVFYGSNSWAYTRLGHITDQTPEQLAAILGGGDIVLTLSCPEK